MKFLYFLSLIFTTYIFAIDSGVSEKNDSIIELSTKEKEFIALHPLIRVGAKSDWAPFCFIENGISKGFSKDILDLLEKYTSLKFEIITGYDIDTLLKMSKEKKIDIFPSINKTAKLSKDLHFTKPYLNIRHYIFTREDDKSISSVKDLKNKTIAVQRNFAHEEILKKKYPEIKILKVKSSLEAIDSLLEHKADAFMDNMTSVNYLMKNSVISGIKPACVCKFDIDELHIGIRKDLSILRDIIQKGLNKINRQDKSRITLKWLDVSENVSSFPITKKEKIFINLHPIVTVANEVDWPPYDFNINGEAMGYSIDLIKLLAKKIGIELKFISGSWSEVFNKFKTGEIDIIHSFYKTEEREEYIYYTKPYINLDFCIVTQEGHQNIRKIDDLNGHIVALTKGSTITKLIKEHYPQIYVIEHDYFHESLRAVAFGAADAAINNYATSNYLIDKHGLSNLSIAAKFSLDPILKSNIYIGFKKEKEGEVLNRLFKRALDGVSEDEIVALKRKWFRNSINTSNVVFLTQEEKKYLKGKQEIKICVNPDWQPIEYKDENKELRGISIDTLHLAVNKINRDIKIAEVKTNSWSESQEFLKQKKCDILPSSSITDKRKEYANFTEPYMDYRLVIITREKHPFVNSFSGIRDKTIARKKGSAVIKKLKNRYKNINLVETKTYLESFQKVASGEVYATVATIPVAAYYISKYKLSNLKIAGYTNIDYKLSMALINDEPMLLDIMQKALHAITEDEHADIFNNQVKIKFQQEYVYVKFLKILAVAAVIAVILLYWYYLLAKHNKEIKKASKEKFAFLTNISHEIKTPLNVVSGYSQLLSSTNLDKKQERYVEGVRDSTNLLLEIINDILNFSTIEANKIVIKNSPIDLKKLIVSISKIFNFKLKERNLKLKIIFDEDFSHKILIDEQKVKQIVINLLGNAIKATNKGMITIDVKVINEEDKNRLYISIIDTGIGIDKSEQEVVFKPFAQQKEQDSNYMGTGLGLTISKKFAEAMNGDILLESEKNVGSTFTFTLYNVEISDDKTEHYGKNSIYNVNNQETNGLMDLDEVKLEVLQNQLKHLHGEYEKVKKSKNFNDLEIFAEELKEIAIENSNEELKIFSNQLISDIKNFNIEEIESKFNKLNNIFILIK